MNENVSVLDVMDGVSFGSQRDIRDEVAAMDASLRSAMDKGLSPEDMKVAQAARKAVQSALTIIEKLFA